jgi:hypothetical protein
MSQHPFVLAESDHGIQIPAGACQTTVFAADQLFYYLALVTGHQFPVREAAGDIRLEVAGEASQGTEDHYGVKVSSEGILLWGRDAASVLFAVYDFLETYAGCRWLSAFEGGEIIPRHEDLSIPQGEYSRRPVFTHRAFTNYPSIDERTVQMVDWMAKNRFNRFMVFANVAGAWERYREVLKPHLALRGMKVEMGHHSFKYWLPPEEYFEQHPEWFAVVDGERSTRGQVCTSNPEVAREMAANLRAFLTENPEVDMVGLWPNDGFGWCECEQCRALEPQRTSTLYPPHAVRTETYFRFANEVARLVAQEHPNRRLSTLAYVNYVEPPSVKLEPNISVCYAPFQHCYKHPLEAPAECVRPNARYAEMLAPWRERVMGELYLFAYWMMIDMCSLPYRMEETLAVDLPRLAELGVDGYVMEFKPEEWGTYGRNAHLIGRLSWDAKTDVAAFNEELDESLYGPAASEMGAFAKAFVADYVEPGPCVHHYALEHTRRATEGLLRPAMEHLGRALAAACTGEKRHVEAVERTRVGVDLLLRFGEWQRAYAEAQSAEGPKKAVLVQRAVSVAEGLIAWIDTQAKSGAMDAPRVLATIRSWTQRLQRQASE